MTTAAVGQQNNIYITQIFNETEQNNWKHAATSQIIVI